METSRQHPWLILPLACSRIKRATSSTNKQGWDPVGTSAPTTHQRCAEPQPAKSSPVADKLRVELLMAHMFMVGLPGMPRALARPLIFSFMPWGVEV